VARIISGVTVQRVRNVLLGIRNAVIALAKPIVATIVYRLTIALVPLPTAVPALAFVPTVSGGSALPIRSVATPIVMGLTILVRRSAPLIITVIPIATEHPINVKLTPARCVIAPVRKRGLV